MEDMLTAIALGFVEGVTEMLPVSSTGHLILVNQWLSFGEPFTQMFDIVIQCGAILAVLSYFWSRVSPFVSTEKRREVFALWLRIGIGILPILLVAYLLGGDILERFFRPEVVATALIIGGVLLVLVDRYARTDGGDAPLSSLGFLQVVFIALSHVLGLIPGMSRSASATIGGMAARVHRKNSSEFSMLMAIPVLFAASLYSLLKFEGSIQKEEWALLAVGFLVSWIVCALAVRWFFRFIDRFGLATFGYYRIVLGTAVLLFLR